MRVDRYAFQDPVGPLLARLDRAAVSDKAAERLKSRWTGFGCLGIALVVAGIVGGAAAGLPVLFAIAVLGLPVAVVCFVKAARHGRHDLDDRKLASARRLLALLRADIPKEWPVAIEVDFRPYDKTEPLEKTGGRFGPKAFRYEQRWLQLRANLADGTALVVSLTDRVSRKEKPKRKRTKVSETFVTLAALSLRLDKRYGDASAAASRLAGTSPDPAWRVRFCRGRGRVLKATLATPAGRRVQNRGTTANGMDGIGNADTLLRSLRWIYAGLASPRAA
jgi:hypothetical protein